MQRLPKKRGPISCGFTLIEMVLVIVVLIALASGSLTLLSKLTDAEMKYRDSVRQTGEIRRFAAELRKTAAESNAFETLDRPAGIKMRHGEDSTEFRSSQDGRWIEMRSMADDKNSSESILRRDRYWIGEDVQTKWIPGGELADAVVEIHSRSYAVFRIECRPGQNSESKTETDR
tara:strand:- start:5407 stop:5931 length:525 start_codon:yes stop_codon:yes gene_type:complete